MYNQYGIVNFKIILPRRRGLVASSRPIQEETGAMGREIESRQSIEW
jgi:hypothetical protein